MFPQENHDCREYVDRTLSVQKKKIFHKHSYKLQATRSGGLLFLGNQISYLYLTINSNHTNNTREETSSTTYTEITNIIR